MAEKVLTVEDLVINFKTDNGILKAVRNVSFDLERGETLCIVGESGSGKSVTSKAIMGILANNAIVEGGRIMYRGENLLEVSEDEFYKIRGHKIGMIFQDPLSSLNPIVRIGKQITEAMLINSDKLKLMYQDLISDDLIAYKNTIAKMKIKSDKERKKFELVKIAFEKEETDLKDQVKNELQKIKDQRIILKHNIKLETYHFKNKITNEFAENREISREKLADTNDAYRAKFEEIKFKIAETDNKDEKLRLSKEYNKVKKERRVEISKIQQESKVNATVINHKYQAKLADNKARLEEFDKEAAKQAKEIKKLKVVNMKKLKEIKPLHKAELAKRKATLKEELARIKAESAVKAAPLKEKLKVTEKAAKETVKKYELKVKQEHALKVSELTQLYAGDSEKLKKAIEEEKIAYTDKLKLTKSEAKKRALEIMKEVGIPQPEKRFKQYPFEFSGGMRQRIVIAIALTAAPEILICDEPTTALDVTIQAQILELINRIKAERNLSCIFITHDLGVVANMADRVAVMYAGKIVEYGTAEEIFYDPRHPYTWALLSSIPDVDSKEKLDAIPGTPPNMIYPPVGDAFAARSKYAMDIDFKAQPPYFKLSDTHFAATWLLDPRAPKVEMPKIVSERIKNALKEDK